MGVDLVKWDYRKYVVFIQTPLSELMGDKKIVKRVFYLKEKMLGIQAREE